MRCLKCFFSFAQLWRNVSIEGARLAEDALRHAAFTRDALCAASLDMSMCPASQ